MMHHHLDTTCCHAVCMQAAAPSTATTAGTTAAIPSSASPAGPATTEIAGGPDDGVAAVDGDVDVEGLLAEMEEEERLGKAWGQLAEIDPEEVGRSGSGMVGWDGSVDRVMSAWVI